MTRDEIISMARDAGLAHTQPRAGQYDGGWIAGNLADLTDFAALVAAAEREACAIVCDRMVMYGPVAEVQQRYNKAYADCRDKIRERGVK